MKISILLSINWTDSVLRWITLHYILVTTLCNNAEGICWTNSLTLKREVNDEGLVNPCRWIDDCKIECLPNRSLYNSSVYVQSVYDTHPECNSSGVKLILPSNANSDFSPNWFSATVKIIELEMDLSKIYRIQENPFESRVFATVEKLTLKNLHPCEFQKFTFTGLQSLESLTITDIRFEDISNIQVGVLEFVKDTLKVFELIEMDNKNKAISINNFIGGSSAVLSKMEHFKIQYNLSTINHLSFRNIPNVKELDLSDCQISDIGNSAFQSLGENLQLLNLERNMLMKLPVGIFTDLRLSPTESHETFLKILLSGNPWNCNCDIEHLKKLLGEYSNFYGDVLCNTPDLIRSYPIGVSQFCPDPIVTTAPPTTTTPTTATPTATTPTTTTPTTTTPTTNTPTTTTPTTTTPTTTTPTTEYNTDDNTSPPNGTTDFVPHFTEKECSSLNGSEAKKKILVKSKICQTHVTVTSDEVLVSIENSKPNLALIWFDNEKIKNYLPEYHQSPTIDCVIALQKEIVIKNLNRGKAYTICSMNMVDTTVSPLDCISYHGVEVNGIWLLESSKPLVIGVIVGGLVASIIIGMMMGAIFLRHIQYNPFSGQKISFNFRMALHLSNDNTASNPDFFDDRNDREKVLEQFTVNGKQRYMSGFGCNSKSNSELGSLDNPPPLPPHAKWLQHEENDDNYYATIKY